MTSFTLKERLEREKLVKSLVEEGLSVNQIARRLDVSQQSVAKFLKRRGWRVSTQVAIDNVEKPVAPKLKKKKRAIVPKQKVDRNG